ncbi:MAG: potassium-transporting ATPase subunit KdpA [Bdellovibrionales bacterium]|nr:potassium-transporting ATPase subunit KdpA [Bdellovibrionales bacterium]
MTLRDFIQVLTMLIALTALAPILGRWIASVLSGERHVLHFLSRPMEGLVEKTLGRETYHRDMGARDYLSALLCFNGIGLIFLFLLQMLQDVLPLNPQQLPAPSWHLAFNSAVSFVTNTNWQSYAGEVTYSRLVQMLGFGVQNFVSAATGISVLLVITRALQAKPGSTPDASKLGNFWRDLTRSTVTVLLPLSILFSIVLVSQGVVQTFSPDQRITTLEGAEQTIPLGPAASQIAIKQLGTNGGGYFNVNSAHPLENPTPLSNFLECLAILLIPAALVFTFGNLLGRRREAWTLYGVMMFLLATGLAISLWSEFGGNPALGAQAVMEGKETRFGVANSVLWSTITSAASNGSVNAMHSSLTPLAGMVATFNMMLGEIIFGGVGSGLYGILLFVLLTVFLAGLMVGRTPEYLGRKIEAYEIKMVLIGLLAPSCAVLFFSALALVNDFGLSSLANKGPHGLSEILYAFTSAANNNGSAFAGLNANTPFYNVSLGLSMLIGRFAVIVPVIFIAGSMASKRVAPASAGTFKTDSLLFAILLISTILIVGGLTFLPALTLGPIVEHLLMLSGRTF